MTAVTTAQLNQVTALQQLAQQHEADAPTWAAPLRAAAAKRLNEIGFPTNKHEEWRYTNPARFTEKTYALPTAGAKVTTAQVKQFAIPDLTCSTLVFVNGHYAAEHADLKPLPDGAVVKQLSEAVETHRDVIESHINAQGDESAAAFTTLNAALLHDGVFIYVPANKIVEHPIHVLNITADVDADAPTITNPRTIIIAGENSQVNVIEHYVSLTDAHYFTNAVTQIDAAENAVLSHYLIEQENEQAYQVSTLLTDQQRSSNVDSHTVLFGGQIVRNNVNPRLNGEGCECLVNGLYVGSAKQHMDNHMRVEHNAPHGDSRQFYKGVLKDDAHAVFTGRILVAKGAQKTDAKQTNANLLLSGSAEAITKPQLEIYADDVKCTHGATIGEIDEEAVFYLMARGVEKDAARGLMIYAFAAESFERIKLEPVRAMLAKELLKRLPEGGALLESVI